MPVFKIQKLIRDKRAKQQTWVGLRSLDGTELLAALKQKLVEEALEVQETTTREDLIEELADVYDVLDALQEHLAITADELHLAQHQKQQTSGGFHNKMYAEALELQDGNPLLEYCRSLPDKYPEVK
jgi:hypothetical protein